MKAFICLLFIALAINNSLATLPKNLFPPHLLADNDVKNVGEPLFLTPYIENGKIEEARKLSQVNGLPNAPNITSYSGLLTVNKKYNSNIFFWFFPAMNKDNNAPVLLWLQGGPGTSSLLGLFVEHGPFVLQKDLKANLRNYTWAQEFSMLYIDQPVGTGFSFTDHDEGYAKDQNDVARDLYEALQQFFTIFHDYRKNDFYVTGESYGGKYVPTIAYKIHTEGVKSNISLKGIAIGNGISDPQTMLSYGEFLFQIGLVDENQRNHFNTEEKKAVQLIENGEYIEPFKIFDSLIVGSLINTTTYFTNVTGFTYRYNYLYSKVPDDFSYYRSYFESNDSRRAIHVGNLTFSNGKTVKQHLMNDNMKSVKPWLATLMDSYKVLIYSGQLDILVAAPLTENFLQTVKWSKADQYKKADRFIWKVSQEDSEVAGYVRQVDQFYQIVVRNGGHILPYDQPRASLDMITRFVKNKSYKN